MRFGLLVSVFISFSMAKGQVSTDEAYQRLRERQQERNAASTRPVLSAVAREGTQAIDPDAQSLIDERTREIAALRKELPQLAKALRMMPVTRTTVIDMVVSDPGESGSHPEKMAIKEPNPEYPILQERIRHANQLIDAKMKEIADLRLNSARRAPMIRAWKAAAERQKAISSRLKDGFGSPRAVADQVVALLRESREVREATAARLPNTQMVRDQYGLNHIVSNIYNAEGARRVDPGLCLSAEGRILNMTTAFDYRVGPTMMFWAVDYNFEFIAKGGFVRVNTGHVLLCEIENVFWPVVIDIDGVQPFWESYEHPLATPACWDRILTAWKDHAERYAIVGLNPRLIVTASSSAPTSEPASRGRPLAAPERHQ